VDSLRDNSKAVLIAGPTASGKSALAFELAQKTGGVIINADSMQVYRDLRVITARPTPDEEAAVPHRLYGHVDAAGFLRKLERQGRLAAGGRPCDKHGLAVVP
jgi:tRNA dimethylallyltransferase